MNVKESSHQLADVMIEKYFPLVKTVGENQSMRAAAEFRRICGVHPGIWLWENEKRQKFGQTTEGGVFVRLSDAEHLANMIHVANLDGTHYSDFSQWLILHVVPLTVDEMRIKVKPLKTTT